MVCSHAEKPLMIGSTHVLLKGSEATAVTEGHLTCCKKPTNFDCKNHCLSPFIEKKKNKTYLANIEDKHIFIDS